MHALKQDFITEAEYLEGEKISEVRHEYLHGTAYAMTGASVRHSRVVRSISEAFSRRARAKGCEVFTTDLKLRVDAGARYYYPDVMVVCHPVDGSAYWVDNPCSIVEVLSPSTAATDRREKFLAYQGVASMREYILVDPDTPQVEVWRRLPDRWKHETAGLDGDVLVDCLEAFIPVAEFYRD